MYIDSRKKMISKRADGLSINIVVVAVIAMIVLVVLLAIFSNKIKTSTKTQDDTQKNFESNVCAQTVDGVQYYCSMTSCINRRTISSGFIDCPDSAFCCPKNG